MKVGISTASLFNRIPTESAFDVLRQMRVDTTEVFLNSYYEYDKQFVDALVPRRGNINVHSVHCLTTQFEPQLFSENPRVLADAENMFRKVCYAAYVLGAKFYTFHGPTRLKKHDNDFDYVKLANKINHIIDVAQSMGINVSYENVHWTYASFPEFFKQILKLCPRLYATLDVKQAIQGDEDPFRFMDAMNGRISTVHLCDVDKEGRTALPGRGKFNLEKLFRELDRRDISAPVLIEVYSGDYKDLNELEYTYNYVCDVMQKCKK